MKINLKKEGFIFFILGAAFLLYAGKDLLVLFHSPEIELERSQEMYSLLGGESDKVPVILFMTTWCPACNSAQKFMDREDIPYVYADIESDPLASKLYYELTEGKSVGIPQIVIADRVVSGFRPATILKHYSDNLKTK